MSYTSDFDLLWNGVSGEHERDIHTASLTQGKVAVAAYWPFLSSAYSEQDFENRLSLSLSRISSLVAPEVLDEVVSSLRDDYRLVTGASKVAEKGGKPWEGASDDDENTKKVKKESDDAKDQAEDETGTDNSGDKSDADDEDSSDTQSSNGKSESDDDDDDKSKGNQPNWLSKNQRDKSTTDKDKKTAGTYTPDPSNAGRYHYQDLESLPLNNGDLQGPDGFPIDLAEGEQRTPEAYARQTTPGTWTEGPGMPERPMPQGVARGYQPVASLACLACGKGISGGMNRYCNGCTALPKDERDAKQKERWGGSKSAAWEPPVDRASAQDVQDYFLGFHHGHEGLPHPLDKNPRKPRREEKLQNEYSFGFWDGAHTKNPELASKPYEEQNSAMGTGGSRRQVVRRSEGHLSPMMFDKDGFLVTALVDPQLGAPMNANPYYFNDGSQGLVGDQTFPTDPWGGNVPDRANEYGEVAPQVSSGSEEGQQDGNGYSRSHPGETVASRQSPNFKQAEQYHSPYSTSQDVGGPRFQHIDDLLSDPEHATDSGDLTNKGHREFDRHHQHYVKTLAESYGPDGEGLTWRGSGAAGDNAMRNIISSKIAGGFGGSEPTFKPGDRVLSFRGEGATIHKVIPSTDPGKSHRVQVKWDDPGKNMTWDNKQHPEGVGDQRAYYEQGFKHHPDTVDALGKMVDEAVPHADDIQKVYASTDGRIVDHCPGCDKPRRVHATPHGDEVRHLHNDHVRCFGKTSDYKYVKQQGDKWVVTQKGTGKVLSHHDSEEDAQASFRAMMQSKHGAFGDEHVSNYVQWAKGAGHDPDEVSTLKRYEKQPGISRNHTNHIADQLYIGGGDTDWRKNAALNHGSNVAEHDHSLTFAEALSYSSGYGIANSQQSMFDKEGFLVEAGDYLGRPDAFNPTGRGPDEFKARTWNAYETTRPMQSHEDRNVNTPVLPAAPIKTRNIGPENPQFDRSRTDSLEQPGDDEDEEE